MRSDDIVLTFGEGCRVPPGEIAGICARLVPEIKVMREALSRGYEDAHASINLVDDKGLVSTVGAMANRKGKANPTLLVVVGIGGSNLGTMAVQQAVLGRLYNLGGHTPPRVLYADTVDPDILQTICEAVRKELASGGAVVVNGVSKSGGTTETIANFEILVDVIQRSRFSQSASIVVTTDRGSRFYEFAERHGFDVLEIPSKVGGRYSVFSAVGLFPLMMLHVDVNKLLQGARHMRERCLGMDVENNPAVWGAAILYWHYRHGRNIADLFLFDSDLEAVGKWYRQLVAESLGKEYNTHGERVLAGLTPTVSIGSTDLHSMAQLYLGGPQDKFTMFVEVGSPREQVRIPNRGEFAALVKGLQSRSLSDVMHAILEGTRVAFRKEKRPFMNVLLQDKSEYCMGQFLQFKMMEVMYLACLMDVNPFDQPHVELYKAETRRILGSDGETS